MARTRVKGLQVEDGGIARPDLNTDTPGEAVITKVIAGSGISITSTGVDPGTGDVTITATGGGSGARNIDGGAPDSTYLASQVIDGGGP